jgi:tetratricopeptide (TPR) repeat protein
MSLPRPLDAATEHEWTRLRAQLDFARGFWLGFALLTSPEVSRVLEKRAERVLHEHARSFVVIEVAAEPQAERVLDGLLAAASDWGCIWVRCIQVGGGWDTVMWNLFLRLNERRDALRRRVGGGLVFAVHPSMKPRLRDAAPDLWSVRSLVLEPMPAASALASRRADESRARAEDAGAPAAGWQGTPVSPGPLRDLLETVADLLTRGQNDEAVEASHRSLELIGPGTPPGDVVAALVWASRAEEAIDDAAAAAEHAEDALARLPEEDPYLRAELLDRAARLAERRQDLGMAADLRGRLVRLARIGVDRNPAGVAAMDKLATALANEGDIHLQRGDLAAARDAYTESLQLRRRLLDTAGETPTALRGLSVSLDRIGDVHRDTGDLAAARDAYTESLQLSRRLLDTAGETPTALRDLSVSLNRIGDVHYDTGDLAAARDAYTESLQLRRRLLDTGETPRALRDLSYSLNKVAGVEQRLDHPAEAQAARDEAGAIDKRLAEHADPSGDGPRGAAAT